MCPNYKIQPGDAFPPPAPTRYTWLNIHCIPELRALLASHSIYKFIIALHIY